MKFIKIITILLCMVAVGVNAQNDSEAASLLEKISNKYKNYKTSKIEVKLIIDIPDNEKDVETNATAWLKGDMYKIEFDDKILMSNTESQWMYLKEVNELQISDYNESSMIFLPSKILNVYSSDYLYHMREEYKNSKGELIKEIELSPANKEMEIFKIVVSINTTTMQIIQTTMFEKSGFKYSYKILNLEPNVALDNSFFEFDMKKYNIDPDDITDLR